MSSLNHNSCVEMTTHLHPLVDRLKMISWSQTHTCSNSWGLRTVQSITQLPISRKEEPISTTVSTLMLNSVCHCEVWIWPQTEAPPPFSDPASFSTLKTVFPTIHSGTAGQSQRGRGLRWTQRDKSSRNYSCHVDQSQSLSVWHHINERRFSVSILMAVSHKRMSWCDVSALTNQNSNYEQDYADSTPAGSSSRAVLRVSW